MPEAGRIPLYWLRRANKIEPSKNTNTEQGEGENGCELWCNE